MTASDVYASDTSKNNEQTSRQQAVSNLYTFNRQIPQDNKQIPQQNVFQNKYDEYSKKVSEKNSKTSKVCGILAIVFSALNYCGIPFVHLAGIVLGIIAISKSTPGLKQGNSKATTGLVCGILGILLGVAAAIIGIIIGLNMIEEELNLLFSLLV